VVAELAPAHLRGSYQGVFSLGFSVASFAAPVGGGWVFQHLGGTTLWVGCLAVGLLAAVGFLASGPALTRRLAALRPTDVPLPSKPAPSEPAPSEPQPSELAAQDANA
jgi:MFS family permease